MKNLIEFSESFNIKYKLNALLKEYTSFKTGGPCNIMLFPDNEDKIVKLISFLNKNNIKYFVLGKGSNLLALDSGYDGVIVNMCEYEYIKLVEGNIIECSAGVSLIKVCRFALEHSLSGLEFAYGIPGSVGGAVYMNAGAYGGEIKDVLLKAEYIDEIGTVDSVYNAEADLSYRHSFFTDKNLLITKAYFKLADGDNTIIKAKMDELMGKRKDKQPLEYPSAGSTFKRPEGYFAGALIEECGLKGYTSGGAKVSEKHAGFVINFNNGTAADILSVINHCRETVKKEKNVDLETEVRFIN